METKPISPVNDYINADISYSIGIHMKTSISFFCFSISALLISVKSSFEEIQDTCSQDKITNQNDWLFCQKNVFIPSYVQFIPGKAFERCDILSSVVFESNSQVEKIGPDAFAETGLLSFAFPSSVKEIGPYAFWNIPSLRDISFENDSELILIQEGAFELTGLLDVSIPQKVRHLGPGAFYHCFSLKKISFAPRSRLESIGEEAFDGTSLTLTFQPFIEKN